MLLRSLGDAIAEPLRSQVFDAVAREYRGQKNWIELVSLSREFLDRAVAQRAETDPLVIDALLNLAGSQWLAEDFTGLRETLERACAAWLAQTQVAQTSDATDSPPRDAMAGFNLVLLYHNLAYREGVHGEVEPKMGKVIARMRHMYGDGDPLVRQAQYFQREVQARRAVATAYGFPEFRRFAQ